MQLDPITLEILNNQVVSVVEEMCMTLQRVGRSLYVKETADFACALAGVDGKFFAYPGSIGVSGFVGLDCMPAIREAGTLAEGDVLITNDPYHSQGLATHLPDLHVIAPVFHDGRIIAYLWAFVHCSDIGGRVPSSVSTTNTEIYQEGLQIPPLRLVKKGRIDNEIERLIRVNSRTPDNNMGDIQAMLAAIGLGQRRVATLVQRHGIATFLAAQKDLCAYTARRARAAIEKIPDGSWAFSDYLDSDMVSGLPVRFAVKVVVDRGRITLDFTGTDPQVHAAMNIPSAGKVHPWLTLRIMALVVTLDPGIPLNAGLQFPIEMIAPRGSVVHPVRPAAVGVRHAACVRVNDVLNGALGIALPEVMTAANSGVIIPVVAAEPAGDGERNVQVVEPMTGGTGARHGMDGTDGRDPSISNLANNPVEMVESELGVRILHYGLRAGSGGAGQWRGGMGLELVFRIGVDDTLILARGLERMRFRPWGVQKGSPGVLTTLSITYADGKVEKLDGLDIIALGQGDTVSLCTAGGGGFGDPLEREPALVLSDVRRGLVSVEQARQEYGVVITDRQVDAQATAVCRGRPLAREHDLGRLQWETVFSPAVMEVFGRFLDTLPASRRHGEKVRLIAQVMALLPANFPVVRVEPDVLAQAHDAFATAVAALPAGAGHAC